MRVIAAPLARKVRFPRRARSGFVLVFGTETLRESKQREFGHILDECQFLSRVPRKDARAWATSRPFASIKFSNSSGVRGFSLLLAFGLTAFRS